MNIDIQIQHFDPRQGEQILHFHPRKSFEPVNKETESNTSPYLDIYD